MSAHRYTTLPRGAAPSGDVPRPSDRERPHGAYGVPSWVEKDPRAYRGCGILAHGFARVRCDDCGHERRLADSCISRGVCPSCNTRAWPRSPPTLPITSCPASLLPHAIARRRTTQLPLSFSAGASPLSAGQHPPLLIAALTGGFSIDASVRVQGEEMSVKDAGHALEVNHAWIRDGIDPMGEPPDEEGTHQPSARDSGRFRIRVVRIGSSTAL